MAKNKNKNMNTGDTVVGVFLDEAHAQNAINQLQQSGFNARIADKSAIGAFRNVGLEDDVIRLYEGRYNEGNTIVVATGGQEEDALGIMLQSGAEYLNLSSRGGSQQSSNLWRGQAQNTNYYQNLNPNQRQYGTYDEQLGRARNAEEINVALREETLTPVKQAVQTGEVEVRKVVHEREEQVPVTLRHEEVYVERNAVDRPLQAGEVDNLQDEVLRVPVYEEQAELQKQGRVREEVRIGKRAEEEQQTLSGTTRHEHVEVVENGDINVTGDTQAQNNINQNQIRPYDTNA
jgi:uncharacterized protein (TIGR02271 family)